ncbi:reverse transcriptase domain-containing protein [Tanacetum coccineum]|uniref:Reverse transcriptase domain-containing protein n=1 Tax=Tanacetum coccineum TaxID=301880 RepID=A0ABQ4XKU6_9ASTR
MFPRPLRPIFINQANSGYRPSDGLKSNSEPPGFPPIQNPHANSPNNFNRGNNSIKTEETITTNLLGYTASTSGSELFLVNNTVTNPKEDLKGITTRSGVTIQGPKAVNHDTEVTKDTMPPANNGSTEDVQPPVVQIQTRNPNPESNVTPVVTPVPKASIPFPSRRNDERRKEKANDQIEKFYEIFRDLSFEISFTDALMLMPKFASTLKTLIGNKEKLSELARTPLNENCSAVILNKLPKKLGDPGRFLIPCEFTGITTCNALADLGASINLMPYSVWKSLSLSELTPTCMTLELADRSITEPIGIAEDVFINVGKFQFPADFVVVDFEPDPRVPLILGRCFLKTSHALIDVYEGEITLRVGKEAITFNLDQTSKYTADYNHMTVNKIDVIDMACDEYSQEVLGFSNVIASGNPTPYFEPIVSTASPNLTPFGDSDFLLMEEADSFLALEDDPTSSEVDPTYQDPEGDILILEAILNSEPPPPLPNHEQYMPGGRKELKLCEAKTVEPSVDEPPEVELKELPPHLEYAFLEGDNKLPVIIAKDLKDEEKAALLKVLKSHKRAIAWKLSDIKGVSPEFCTHKILMEEDYEPSVQSQRRVNPKIHDVIKKEVEKLLDAGLIYPISDSPWVSPVHCVPKKGGMTVITNDENELIPTRLVTGWRIPIDPKDQEKTTFTCPYGTFAYRRMPFGLCNAPGTFQRCMMAIFHDMIEKTMERIRQLGQFLGQEKTSISKPIHYASMTMNEGSKNSVHYYERNLLAVVYALEISVIFLLCPKESVILTILPSSSSFAKMDARQGLCTVDLIAQEFDIEIRDKNGAENLAADALSRLENPHQDKSRTKKSMKHFPPRNSWNDIPSKINSSRMSSIIFGMILSCLRSVLIRENRASGRTKLDDALWASASLNKNTIGCTPYKLVYGKACHLPIELEHKAYWALKHTNFDVQTAGDHRKVQLNELNELRDQAYENSLIYKEKTKRIHDAKIKNRVFNVGDRVLLFNSRLKIFSGKLKSRWSGPFTIVQVFPYGTVELSQNSGPNFKVNGHRIKHYFGGDIPTEDFPDCEDSRACSIPQEFHILSFILGIQYPNLID